MAGGTPGPPKQVIQKPITTPAEWAASVLYYANLPQTASNINLIERWMTGEGGNATDPLNVRNVYTGSGAGGFAFPSVIAGVEYTAQTLQQSNMVMIYNALKQSATPATFSAALAASPWDSAHYSSWVSRYGHDFITFFSPATVLKGLTGTPQGSGVTAPGHIPNPLSGLGTVTKDLNTLVHDVTDVSWWTRVGEFLLGAALLIGGALVFLSTTKPGSDALHGAETAAVVA